MKRDLIAECKLSSEMAELARWENEGGTYGDCLIDANPDQVDESQPKNKSTDLVEVVSDGKRPSSDQVSTARKLQ